MEATTRVLLVEDDEDDYVLTRDLLAQVANRSYTLDWVTTFDAGLTAVRAQQHDVYLIDYRLGAESGLDLLRALLSAGCRAPILLLAGQGDPSLDGAAMWAGAADYLVKGEITSTTLERALRHACDREHILALRDQALTALETAQERLRASEQFALSILDALPEQIAILDEDGMILAVNAAWRQFGAANGLADPAALIGQNYAAICTRAGDELAGRIAGGIGDVLSGRTAAFTLEYPSHTPTQRRWFALRATPFAGPGPGRVVAARHDITTSVLARQEILQREESFRLLFRDNPQPMWVYDVATLHFLEVNDAAVDQYGYTRDEFLAMGIGDIRPLEDVAALKATVGQRSSAVHDAGEWRHYTKDGRIITIPRTGGSSTWRSPRTR